MSIDRIQRVNTLLHREIAQAVLTLPTAEPFDRSAITITQVSVARNLRSARVGVSIRAVGAARETLFDVLKRHRAAIQSHLNRVMTLKYTPKLDFRLDTSIEKGDHVLGLLMQMEDEAESSDRLPEAMPPPPSR